MKPIYIASLAGVAPLVVAAGCLFDPDERCSGELVYNESTELCGCPSGSYATEAGCVTCGPNERFIVDSCQCRPGFEREGAACVAIPAEPEEDPDSGAPLPDGNGRACTSDNDCAGTTATYCDTFFDNICIIEDCDVAANTGCPDGETCCDLSNFGEDRQICSKYGCAP